MNPVLCPCCKSLLLTPPNEAFAKCSVCSTLLRLNHKTKQHKPATNKQLTAAGARPPKSVANTRTNQIPRLGVLVNPARQSPKATPSAKVRAGATKPTKSTSNEKKKQRFLGLVFGLILVVAIGIALPMLFSDLGETPTAKLPQAQETIRTAEVEETTRKAQKTVRTTEIVEMMSPAPATGVAQFELLRPGHPKVSMPATRKREPSVQKTAKLSVSKKNTSVIPSPTTPTPMPKVAPEPAAKEKKPETQFDPNMELTRIDELVFAKLEEKGIAPAALCSDEVFVRRVYIDVIGTLPTVQEVVAFLDNKLPNKREILIDQLLDRKEFSDYWAMKWGDILRAKSEFPINLWPNAVRAYHQWIRSSLRDNVPYDRFARSLLTSSGSNFRSPPVNFYRATQGRKPQTMAQAVALTFMGVRADSWPQGKWSKMSTFFSQVGYKATREWKEEIVYFDSRKSLGPDEAVFPDGVRAMIPPGDDPRVVFADWLITPENPWFTRSICNRVWSWLLGRGIIHQADDIRPDNPPSNPELLAYLEQELVAAHYDLKQLYRIILNSKTYQLSCVPASEHPEAAALFASYPVRRLEAEVLIDAICQITGTNEKYYSPIPEPFTYLPQGHRAICLHDASISNAFLEMFGRPGRDTGLESERNNKFTAAQRLHLLNSSHIQKKIEQGPGLAALRNSKKAPKEIAESLYLTILSRRPRPDELTALAKHRAWVRRPAVDVAWALINSAEFLHRH